MQSRRKVWILVIVLLIFIAVWVSSSYRLEYLPEQYVPVY